MSASSQRRTSTRSRQLNQSVHSHRGQPHQNKERGFQHHADRNAGLNPFHATQHDGAYARASVSYHNLRRGHGRMGPVRPGHEGIYREATHREGDVMESDFITSNKSIVAPPPYKISSKKVAFNVQNDDQNGDVSIARKDNDNWFDAEVLSYCHKHRVMYIMRGLPGSGKSTIAKSIAQLYGRKSAMICSADDYRTTASGEYVWSVKSLEQTHRQCEQKAQLVCSKGVHVVIIDNTNIKFGDTLPYLRLAFKHDYTVNFLSTSEDRVDVLAERNVHCVPKESIAKMKSHFADILPYYYAWNIGRSETGMIRDTFRKVFQTCISIPSFKQFATRYAVRGVQFDPKNIYQIYSMKSTTSGSTTSHVTSCYINKYKVRNSKHYSNSAIVQNSLGTVHQLKILGWCITRKSLFARVLLTEEQRVLWGRNDSFTGAKSQVAIERSSWVKSSAEESVGRDWVKLDEGMRQVSIIENDYSMKIAHFIQNIDESYLIPDFNLGCTAHITMGIVDGMKPIDAKIDHDEILQLELNERAAREWKLPQNLLRCYGDNFWVVYLKTPIFISTMFSGSYYHD